MKTFGPMKINVLQAIIVSIVVTMTSTLSLRLRFVNNCARSQTRIMTLHSTSPREGSRRMEEWETSSQRGTNVKKESMAGPAFNDIRWSKRASTENGPDRKRTTQFDQRDGKKMTSFRSDARGPVGPELSYREKKAIARGEDYEPVYGRYVLL